MADLERIQVYSAFREAMLDYFSSSRDDEKRRKSTISHRIATKMMKYFPEEYSVDIDLDGLDILIHSGKKPLLAVSWSNTYLTEKEKEEARHYHMENSPRLTLAFSLLDDKDYILVYRFEKDYLEYLHIDKNTFSEKLLKRCEIYAEGEGAQLMLDIKPKKQKTKKRKDNTPEKEKIEG